MSNTPTTEQQNLLYVGEDLPTADKYISPFRFGPSDIKIGNGLQDYSGVFKNNNTKYNDLRLDDKYLCLPEATQTAFPWGTVVNVPLSNWKLGEDGSTWVKYLDLSALPRCDGNFSTFYATELSYDSSSKEALRTKNVWNDNIYYENTFQLCFLNNEHDDCEWKDTKGIIHTTTVYEDIWDNLAGIKAEWDDPNARLHKAMAGPIYKITDDKIICFNLEFKCAYLPEVERSPYIDQGWIPTNGYEYRTASLAWIFDVKIDTDTIKEYNHNKLMAIGLQGQGGYGGGELACNGTGGGGGGFIGGILNTTGRTWYIFGGGKDKNQAKEGSIDYDEYVKCAKNSYGKFKISGAESAWGTGNQMACIEFNTNLTEYNQLLAIAHFIRQMCYPYVCANHTTDSSIYLTKKELVVDQIKSVSKNYIIANGGGGGTGANGDPTAGGAGGQTEYNNNISTNHAFWATTEICGGSGAKTKIKNGHGDNIIEPYFTAYKEVSGINTDGLTLYKCKLSGGDGGKNGDDQYYSGGGGASALGPGGNGGARYCSGNSPESGFGGGGGGARFFLGNRSGAYGTDGCWLLFN